MQGRLRDEYLSVEVETECGQCGRTIQFTLDSKLNFQVKSAGAQPLVFEPHLDWETFTEPNIVHAF